MWSDGVSVVIGAAVRSGEYSSHSASKQQLFVQGGVVRTSSHSCFRLIILGVHWPL